MATTLKHRAVLDFASSLDAASNMFGRLGPEIRARLWAVVDAPTQEAWSDAHSIVISCEPRLTLWQALIRFTSYDVMHGSTDGNPWPKLPTSVQILRALRHAADESLVSDS